MNTKSIETMIAKLHHIDSILKTIPKTEVARNELQDIEYALSCEVRSNTAKSAGSTKATSTVNRILKRVRKDRIGLGYAWIDSENRQCICDGYVAYRFTKHLPLEPRPEEAGKPIDINPIFPNTNGYREIELPDIETLRQYKADYIEQNGKTKFSIMYDMGHNNPVFNVDYLIDLLTIFPDAKTAMVENGAGCMIKPMYVKSDNGEAIILPVRTGKQYESTEKDAIKAQVMQIINDYNKHCEADADYAMDMETFEKLAALTAKLSA